MDIFEKLLYTLKSMHETEEKKIVHLLRYKSNYNKQIEFNEIEIAHTPNALINDLRYVLIDGDSKNKKKNAWYSTFR